MKLVKESLNFERGLSDKEIIAKLTGWRKGQILIEKWDKIFNSKIQKIWIYMGVNPGRKNLEINNILGYPLGEIDNNGNLKLFWKDIGYSNIQLSKKNLRFLNNNEKIIFDYYNNLPENKKYKSKTEKYLNTKIFI
jgi:hypothetical protein